MGKSVKGQKIDTVLVLLTFCVFAVSVLLVLMLSARVYKNMTQVSSEAYNEHIVLSYIWTKVKNEDNEGKITVDDFNGLSALSISADYGGTEYKTMIYRHNGWIYELFSEAGLGLAPEDGTALIESGEPLGFELLEGGLIRASSGARNLIISPRSVSGIALEGGLAQ
ncbi:MAG: DUF4860 domain-containing protein [Oscillospiraceae bacterium]|nr:DUF4860 domain-containing protein [Oscillospiraceae bacterium]